MYDQEILSTSSLSPFVSALAHIFSHPETLPEDWSSEATTYDLTRFDSKGAFLERFESTLKTLQVPFPPQDEIRERLYACGHPYDYARLGHPMSSVYEWVMGHLSGFTEVFSFASRTKPFLAPIEARDSQSQPVVLVCEAELPLDEAGRNTLNQMNVDIIEHTNRLPELPDEALTLYVSASGPSTSWKDLPVDGVVFTLHAGGVLLIKNPKKIDPQRIQVLRKRTTAALLVAQAHEALCEILGLPNPTYPHARETVCNAALGEIYGAISEADSLYFCTGLAAESAVFRATSAYLSPKAPLPLYYAQNGYGGTGQLIGEVLAGSGTLKPMPLQVMGHDEQGRPLTLVDRFISALNQCQGEPLSLFVETPTNPELQVHQFEALRKALDAYEDQYGTRVPVIVDTTMAPLYPLFELPFAQDWPFIIVKSGSKYYTKGKATLGVAFCGHNPMAKDILAQAALIGRYEDSFAKGHQLQALLEGLTDLRPRMAQIAQNTHRIAKHLKAEFAQRNLSFVCYTMTPEQIDAGLATGILSFYLPPAPTDAEDLVDEFVDFMLTQAPNQVKNRVSYGQSSGEDAAQDWVYIINPQESTQGSLSQEIKEAQKRDNVQICRLSVPARCNTAALNAAISQFIESKYGAASA